MKENANQKLAKWMKMGEMQSKKPTKGYVIKGEFMGIYSKELSDIIDNKIYLSKGKAERECEYLNLKPFSYDKYIIEEVTIIE